MRGSPFGRRPSSSTSASLLPWGLEGRTSRSGSWRRCCGSSRGEEPEAARAVAAAALPVSSGRAPPSRRPPRPSPSSPCSRRASASPWATASPSGQSSPPRTPSRCSRSSSPRGRRCFSRSSSARASSTTRRRWRCFGPSRLSGPPTSPTWGLWRYCRWGFRFAGSLLLLWFWVRVLENVFFFPGGRDVEKPSTSGSTREREGEGERERPKEERETE